MLPRVTFIAILFFLAAPCLRAAEGDEAAEWVKKLAKGKQSERDKAEESLRKLGKSAVPALRDAKSEDDDATTQIRNLLTDIALETAAMTSEDAAMVHAIAREEGKGKRYNNAERLYRRGEQLYDQLKDDADRRKDKVKEQEYAEKQRICDRMKDKAERKISGKTHTGVNLGFARVGKDHDMSDDWE